MSNGGQKFTPGWYDNGHGRQQWHDGKNWTSQFQPEAKKPRRQVPLIALAWTTAAALVFGVLVGSAGAGGNSPAEDQALNVVGTTSTPAVPSSAPVVENAELIAAQEQLVQNEAAVNSREKKLAKAEAKLKTAQKKLKKAQAKVKKQAAKLKRQADKPKAQPSTPSYVYYENCDAARAAGAAPVYRGDPGYASHLDRDNDGIGCE